MKLNPFQAIQNNFGTTAVPGGAPSPATANPFADMLAQMPQTGWARPEAQAYWQQAMQSQPLFGNGAAPTAGGGFGGAPFTPGPGQEGYVPKLASEINASPEARKFLKQFRKGKAATDYNWKDVGNLALQTGLGAMTGGATAAIGAANGVYGTMQGKKAAKQAVKQVKRLRDSAMSELGYNRVKKGGRKYYVDAQGNKLGGSDVFQLMWENGYLGG